MQTLLVQMLSHLVREGQLTVIMPDGSRHLFGNGNPPAASFSIHDNSTVLQLLIDPDLHLGEAYMHGKLNVVEGTIHDVLRLLFSNLNSSGPPATVRLPYAIRKKLKRLQQKNGIGLARRNVAHHYDLSGQLYDLFLDSDRQYSCAYFEKSGQTLEDAQLAKKRHLAAKLLIEPGMHVLDIGSGWGGLALYLAQVCGARVTGVTLSQEQHRVSMQRVAELGLGDQVHFELMDYRELEGDFDRIVSVGMFEHVGVKHYSELFSKVQSLLKPSGIFLLHSIGRSGGPGATSAWIRKYIFPGGYCPALSEVIPEVEKAGLYMTDVEILRLHYARTLAEWRKRFAVNRQKAVELYDETFARMWEFYLSASELSFRHLDLNNFQLQTSADAETVPLTRDYIAREEINLRKTEAKVLRTGSNGRPASRFSNQKMRESRHYPQT